MGKARTGPEAVADYLRTLKVPRGRYAGQPLKLFQWELDFLRGAFRPGVAEAALSLGRGGGKTLLCAGIAAAAVDGPLRVWGGETLLVASSFNQARIAFEYLLDLLGRERLEGDAWRILDSQNAASVQHVPSGARVRCIGSDPRRAHGLSGVLWVLDEPAQWPEAPGERMLAASRTSLGKERGARLIAIGTRPDASAHWFEALLQGGADYAQCHAAPKGADPQAPATWLAANPGLNRLPDLRKAIAREAQLAALDPMAMQSFKALRLNMGVADTTEAVLLDADLWEAAEGDVPPGDECYWGVDLGGVHAASSVAAYWPGTGRLEAVSAFPAVPPLADRSRADGVAALYPAAADRGELLALGGRTVPVADLLAAALAEFGAPVRIAADRWRLPELADAMEGAGLDCPLDARGQGFRDGSEDLRCFQRGVLNGAVTPVESLFLAHCIGNARVMTDPAGNQKLAKATQGGRRKNARDDAAAAAILAVATADRHYAPDEDDSLLLGIA